MKWLNWIRRRLTRPQGYSVRWDPRTYDDICRQYPDRAQRYNLSLVLFTLKVHLIKYEGKPAAAVNLAKSHGPDHFLLRGNRVEITYRIDEQIRTITVLSIVRLGGSPDLSPPQP